MTRIVHTADVHLDPEAPERLAGFEAVIEHAETHDAAAVTVGGDLFDSERAAEQLRPRLRRICTDRSVRIVVLPGNHDTEAFRGDRFYGADVRTMTDGPFGHVDVDDLRLTTVPFVPELDEDMLVALRRRVPHDGPEALLLHCSLRAPLAGSTGKEDAPRYCPVRPGTLAELEFDYVLAGHYHDQHLRSLGNGSHFVYPGSPASVTRGERGRRTVAMLDTAAADPVRLAYLDTFHYDAGHVRVTPGTEADAVDRVESLAETWTDRDVEGRIVVEGFTEWEENRFAEALPASRDGWTVENRTRSARHPLRHPLYRRFREELDERSTPQAVEDPDEYDRDAFTEEMETELLSVMNDLLVDGTLR